MRPRTIDPRVIAPPLLLAFAACRTPTLGEIDPSAEPPTLVTAPGAGWEAGAADANVPLYAWDGSPVGSRVPGSVARTSTRDDRVLDEQGGSRFVLLELYSQAVQERDEYLLEIDAQNEVIAQAEERYAELELRHAELAAANDALAAEKAQLQAENQDLAARLATAQIRRLEAEKAWLESAIEWERRGSATSTDAEGNVPEEEF